MEDELKRHDPNGQALTSTDQAIVVSTLNSGIRNRGLSAREILFQREGNTAKQLTFRDQELAESQYNMCRSNHDPSAKCSARGGNAPRAQPVSPGDLIHLKCDGYKHTARPTYLVLACGREFIQVQKLVGVALRRRKYRLLRARPMTLRCYVTQVLTTAPTRRGSPRPSVDRAVSDRLARLTRRPQIWAKSWTYARTFRAQERAVD